MNIFWPILNLKKYLSEFVIIEKLSDNQLMLKIKKNGHQIMVTQTDGKLVYLTTEEDYFWEHIK